MAKGMTDKQKTILMGAGIATAAIIYAVWKHKHAMMQTAATMFSPATVAAYPNPIGGAANTFNLNFQTPNLNFTNQATGYVPLFGFVGVGSTWG